jgi:Holliday junction resolvase RusA-like endonuclease
MAKGRPMAMMYETKLAKDYKKEIIKLIKQEVKKQNFTYQDDKFAVVEYTFFFPRTNMDTNNYYKCFVDAITESGVIWKDDNMSLMRDKRIYYDSAAPRVEVEIEFMASIGIFDNEEDLDWFVENNCKSCKRGDKIGQKGGCSVYKKAMENRIQDDLSIDFDTGDKICLVKKE